MKRITVASTITTLFVICFVIIILSDKHCDDCFSGTILMAKLFACGLVILIGSIYFTWLYLKNENSIFKIEMLPLLDTNEATSDVAFSCEGTVVPSENGVLTAPYTGFPCVYYHSITEERVGSGKNKRWVVIENLINLSPFYVADERGKLKIDPTNLDNDFSGFEMGPKNRQVPDPENSEIDCSRILSYSEVPIEGKFMGIFTMDSHKRRSEYILPPSARVFACGFITKRNGELVLHEHPSIPLIISQKTKSAFIGEFYKGNTLVFLVHILTALGFTIAVLSINYFLNIGQVLVYLVLIAGNTVILGGILFTTYNRLHTLFQRAQFALHDIDIELKRRSELIPRIVTVVKEYAKYEHDVQVLLASLREHTVFSSTLPGKTQTDMTRLTAIVENYPQIRADAGFNNLMINLIDTEERIVYARAFYNRNVRKFNTLVRMFPFNMISGLMGMRTMQFVTITTRDAELPAVEI